MLCFGTDHEACDVVQEDDGRIPSHRQPHFLEPRERCVAYD